MAVEVITYPILGATIPVGSGDETVTITTATPAANYYLFAQTSEPIICWQASVGDTTFTVGLQGPADPGTNLNYILVNKTNGNASIAVVPAGQDSINLDIDPAEFSVFIMPTWNTTSWITPEAFSTLSINFSNGPGADSFIYIYKVPIGLPKAFTEPILPGAPTAAVELLNGSSFIPFVMPYWNTAIGVAPISDLETLFLQFSNPGPDPDSQVTYFTQFVQPAPPAFIVPTVPAQQPFELIPLDAATLENRLANLYPNMWTNDQGLEPGGIAHALFYAYASTAAFIMLQLQYAWQSARLQTSIGQQLDIFSEDYFGNQLPRLAGEGDDHYRNRIKSLLLQPRVTRDAIANLITFFTGGTVRMIEPWNPSDTGYYGTNPPFIGSYFDFDSKEVPSLWGDPGLRYQGFIQIELPPAQGNGVNIWGYDAGAGYDLITGIEWETSNQFALLEQVVNQLISHLIAFGTIAWVKYVAGFINPITFGASVGVATGLFQVTINTPNLAGLYGFFTQLSLPISTWIESTSYNGFLDVFAVPVGSGTFIQYLGVENGSQFFRAALAPPDALSIDLTGDYVANNLFPCPTWNTDIWYSNKTNSGITLNFSNPPAVDQGINLLTVPVNPNIGVASIEADALTWEIVVTVDQLHVPFCIANWNTSVGVHRNRTAGTIILTFSQPAPSDGSGEIMFSNVEPSQLN